MRLRYAYGLAGAQKAAVVEQELDNPARPTPARATGSAQWGVALPRYACDLADA